MWRPTARAALLLLAALPARAEEVPATGGSFGGVGLVEMRNARFREDGVAEIGASLRHQRRFWFASFQALPFLETTFRLTERLNATTGRGTTTDRALDLKVRLLEEGAWTPAVAIGAQDLIGTGIYGGEYLVASRRWHAWDLTFGIGWGRLATGDGFDNPLAELHEGFATRPRDVGRGGTFRTDLFRGPRAAPFGGVEWSLPAFGTPLGEVEGLRLKAEWSSDALRDERGGYPVRRGPLRGEARSPVNLGLSWSGEHLDASLAFVHGTDLLLRLSLRADPAAPPAAAPLRPAAALPARPRGEVEGLGGRVFAALSAAGFRPVSFGREGGEARIAVEGGPVRTAPRMAARVLRAVNGLLPPETGVLRLSWWQAGVEVARLLVPRGAVEGAIRGTGSAEEAWAAAALLPAEGGFEGAEARRALPAFDWGVEPRLSLVLGDPTRALRWQVAGAAGARLDLGDGYAVAGAVQQVAAGNLGDGPPSDSQLPRVRSDYARYARDGRTAVTGLYAERIWNVAPDLFARASAGLLETMFGGVSAEVLWRPHDRPWALGLDLNAVQQRQTDGGFGFRRYGVVTGHVSLYGDLPFWNLYGVLRAGRYLAGDWGATLELGRRFDSGIEIGGFATLTNVPASRFGEGSFDKGIYVRVPLELFGGETGAVGGALIRPVQRDGGQRLAVDHPLWELTREGRDDAVRRALPDWGR